MIDSQTLSKLRTAAVDIAMEAGRHTLNYYDTSVEVARKKDGSPVTAADREAEQIMREYIGSAYPEHQILGEEFEPKETESPFRWILDPIDGTLSFIHGVPLYTTLVAVTYDDHPLIGVIYAPALNEICDAAEGQGTRFNGKEAKIRKCESIEEATFLSTDVQNVWKQNLTGGFEKLAQTCRLHRTWGDAYGHMMVATGRADIMIDPILNIWDAAPLYPIIREAGGLFTDLKGEATIHGGDALSCNPVIQQQVLELFAR